MDWRLCVTVLFFYQAAYQAGEDEVNLSTMGRSYAIDFNSMQQINEDTGTARPVQRKLNPLASSSQHSSSRSIFNGLISEKSHQKLRNYYLNVLLTNPFFILNISNAI